MHIHILGIAGTMTTPIALELKKQGHIVSGSDQVKIYPPFSNLLVTAKIPINTTPINKEIDLFIVGSGYKNLPKTQSEFLQIQSQKWPYISATQFLAQQVIKPQSILVAGAYGKSTISALLSWLFVKLNLKPSFYFGGISIDNLPSLAIANGQYSIIEADESINGLDTQAKFLYYPAKHLILTSAQWEHKDSYKTAHSNFNAFKELVKKLPVDGILVYNQADPEVLKLLPFSNAKKIPYQDFNFTTKLIGSYNHENINAVLTLCRVLNLDLNKIIPLITDFNGIKRRLEIIHQEPLIIDDFAQSPERVKSAINAITKEYPNRPVKVFFEPHASFLSYKSSLVGFSTAFSPVFEVIVSQIKFNPTISKTDRTTFANYLSEIGPKAKYLPILDDVQEHFKLSLKPNDILIHFSSGGLNGLNCLKKIAKGVSSS